MKLFSVLLGTNITFKFRSFLLHHLFHPYSILLLPPPRLLPYQYLMAGDSVGVVVGGFALVVPERSGGASLDEKANDVDVASRDCRHQRSHAFVVLEKGTSGSGEKRMRETGDSMAEKWDR